VNVRAFITTALEVVGLVLIVCGFAAISVPAAVIAAGFSLALIGWAQS